MTATDLCRAIFKSLAYHTEVTVAVMKKDHGDAWNIVWLHHMGYVTPKKASESKLLCMWEDMERIRQSKLKTAVISEENK